MPTSKWRCACAAGTARPAAAKKTAPATPMRLSNYRLPPEAGQHPAQPFLQFDLRLPAEQLARTCDVGLADLRIVHRQGLMDDLALRAGHPEHRLGGLGQRGLVRG